eukprot:COSAG03_NODE_2_length_28887_cov_60.449825_28_plen_103_part_00
MLTITMLLPLLATLHVVTPAAVAVPATMSLYVAPSGSDTAAGTASAPLASCAGAVARIKKQPPPLPSITVHFAAGTYPLTNATACGTINFVGSKAAPIVLRE